ncbi:MAG: C39 family peptidase [Candidatus Sericytochromatia bacterium]|nr:C39 family peptidase [Candidatus Sericytochromatia bacterium]
MSTDKHNLAPTHKPCRIGDQLRQANWVSRFQIKQALTEQKRAPEKLGRILKKLGFLPESTNSLSSASKQVKSAPLGERLLRSGWITQDELNSALQEQYETEEELGSLLVRKGCLAPHQLEQALTELLLERTQRHRQKLGCILLQTQQISHWQLDKALSQQQRKEPLGQILLRLNWLCPQKLAQALRLQKKLLRSAAAAFLGSSLLLACQPPTVPLQFADAGNLNAPPVYQVQSQANLNGAFKTLSVKEAADHDVKIRIYQNGSKVIENVPFFRQGRDNTCGQAVVAMVTNFWGMKTTYQNLVDKENPLNLATSAGMLSSSFRAKGLAAQDFRRGDLTNILDEINKGRPTPVLLDFGNIQSAHYVVVVGYNMKKGTFIMHDSLEGPYVEMDQMAFLKMWENKSVRNILPVGADNYQRLMFRVFHPEQNG